jgi:hypothetical protein
MPRRIPLSPAALVLLATALLQNLAELKQGGPALPIALDGILPATRNPEGAVFLISVLLALLLGPVAYRATAVTRFAAALAAGGLGLNAVVQVVASLIRGTLLPGTLTGALLILPAALVVLVALGRPATLPALLGAALSPAVLLLCWQLAALI